MFLGTTYNQSWKFGLHFKLVLFRYALGLRGTLQKLQKKGILYGLVEAKNMN